MEKEMIERVYCAAIWYKELPAGMMRNPSNIDRGVVVLGHRHADIIANVMNLLGFRTVTNGDKSVGEHVQGFLTNKYRFVDRGEGAVIARQAGQLLDESTANPNVLFSEDIY